VGEFSASGEPLDLDALIAATGDPLPVVAMALGRLEAGGWLMQSGGWFERVRTSRAVC
jgi:hypothetical protein